MTIHVVQPGESVYSIAHLYKVPMERIISDNGLSDPSRLAVGQALVIRYPRQYHIVEQGDTLGSIAARHGTTVTALYQLNPELNGLPLIAPGQVLILSLEQPKEGTLAVNGYAYPGIDRTVLRRTLPYLTWLSVFAYGFTPEGGLLGQQDTELVQLARDYGVAPLLVLTTIGEDGSFSSARAHALLQNDAAQATLLENLARTMHAKGYEGLDIDFEYIPPEDREAFTAFVRRAAGRLNPLGFLVSAALAPKTSATQPGLLYEAHDYRALGEAADQVRLMTYEWGYSRSAPRAVAPLDKVREVVQYAKTEIPADKIMMGVPNYGYEWTAGQPVARSLVNAEAVQLAIQKNAAIEYDWTAQSPHFSFWQDRLAHNVWFEDARSVRAKLALAASEGLHGVSIWTIMRYFPQLFLVLSSLYNIEKRM